MNNWKSFFYIHICIQKNRITNFEEKKRKEKRGKLSLSNYCYNLLPGIKLSLLNVNYAYMLFEENKKRLS